MSNGSLQRSPSSVEPHATIGAQDLVQNHPDRCGFLRKRGQKERVLENLHLSRHINWRQRFVVIADGCCYCFADEVARTPQQGFSLQGYNKIFRHQSDRAAFVFRLEPADRETARQKSHTFAATTDSERIAWMQTFRSAMVTANDVNPTTQRSNTTEEEDIYVALEEPIYEPAVISPGTSGAGDSAEESEDEGSSDDSNYDRPDELLQAMKPGRRNVPLPPVPQDQARQDDVTPSAPAKREALLSRPKPPPPGGSGDGGMARRSKPPELRNRPAVPLPGMTSPQHASSDVMPRSKPPPGAKPTTHKKTPSRRLSERESLFDNSDREAAIEIIRDSHIPGTFLIRKSRQGDSKVLVVMTAEDVKEYKIFLENGQCTLDRKTFFPSMDDLLNSYSTTPLPNRQQTLSRSYSSSSDR